MTPHMSFTSKCQLGKGGIVTVDVMMVMFGLAAPRIIRTTLFFVFFLKSKHSDERV